MGEANINCLTSCDRAQGEEMIGTWSYNNIDCVIWKSDEPIGFSYEADRSYAGAPWVEIDRDGDASLADGVGLAGEACLADGAGLADGAVLADRKDIL